MPNRRLVQQTRVSLAPHPSIVICLVSGEAPSCARAAGCPLFVWRGRSGLWVAGLRGSNSAASGTIGRVGQSSRARMAKLADAADLKSADRKVVGVQVPLRAPKLSSAYMIDNNIFNSIKSPVQA